MAGHSVDPELARRSGDEHLQWSEFDRWGEPRRFSVDPQNEPNPLTTQSYSLGLQLDLSAFLTQRKNPTTRGVKVFFVSEDSPAWRAGMRKGQTITAYNGQPAGKVDWFQTFESFQDKAGSFTFQDAKGQLHEALLNPELSTESAELWKLDSESAVLRIRSFNIETPARVYHLLQASHQMFPQGVPHFILDLRAPCGELGYMQEVAGYLLGSGQNLATATTRGGKTTATSRGGETTATSRGGETTATSRGGKTTALQSFTLQSMESPWLGKETDSPIVLAWARRQSFQIVVGKLTGLSGEVLGQALVNAKRGGLFGDATEGNPYYAQTFSVPQSVLTVSFPSETITIPGTALPLVPSARFRTDQMEKFYLINGGAF